MQDDAKAGGAADYPDIELLNNGLPRSSAVPGRPVYAAPAPGRVSVAGLEPYAGPWDERHAEHLLRRATFGPTRAEVRSAAATSLDATVKALFATQAAPSDPYGYGASDPADQKSAKRIWAWSEYIPSIDFYYRAGIAAWWFNLMYTSGTSLREKMVLFWHNHFVSELSSVLSAKYMHMQNMLLRSNAFGNFRTLVGDITVDPAMLIYLNGETNTKGKANENYARELQELFTIGKGQEIGPGNYTTYTESDVREAARVLTGWRETRATYSSSFNATQHDTGDKTFSAAYQNTIIIGRSGADGAKEVDDLRDMILRQDETAKHICRKLYRWFVYYRIDSAVEAAVIEPMANLLRSSNYEVLPVLDTLFRSAHFHSDDVIGSMIKNPMDFLIGLLREGNLALPNPQQDQLNALNVCANFVVLGAGLQLELFNPPNVAGWPAYYQEPQYHELWINTATFPTRGGISDSVIDGKRVGTVRLQVDLIEMVKAFSDPGNPRVVIAELSAQFFPFNLTQTQQDYLLANVFLPGLPDYEWGVEWNDYIANPANAQKKALITTKLADLAKFLLRLAEYQLS